MHRLQRLVRSASAVCFVSVAASIVSPSLLRQLEHLADTVFTVSSFDALPGGSDPLLKDYDGLLVVDKLPHVNSLCGFVPDRDGWRHLLKVHSSCMNVAGS